MTRFIKLSILLALITAVLPREKASAEIFPASDCREALDALWLTTLDHYGFLGTIMIEEWGVGNIGSAELVNGGTTVWVKGTDQLENCTDACGCEDDADDDDEPVLPNPITGTMSASVTFTDSVTTTLTGSVSGSTFLTAIKAELEASSETTNGHQTTATHSVSVTLPPCQWQIIYTRLKAVNGKQMQVTATLQPWIRFSKNSNVLLTSGATQTFIHTVTVDSAVQGTAAGGTENNGSCPPDPPF